MSSETLWLVIWIITGLFSSLAFFCIGKGLKLHRKHPDIMAKQLEEYRVTRIKMLEKANNKLDELRNMKKRQQGGEACEVNNIDWWIYDLEWWKQDLEWDMREAQWEKEERIHQRKTSIATFWNVLGAALFALAGLIVNIGAVLIK